MEWFQAIQLLIHEMGEEEEEKKGGTRRKDRERVPLLFLIFFHIQFHDSPFIRLYPLTQ